MSGDEGDGEDEKTTAVGEFDSRRNIVLIKLHCIQSRYANLPIKFPYSGETFDRENFRGSIGREHFVEKTFAEC